LGFSKEIARRGSIGGTARWAAQLYFHYIASNNLPNFNNQHVLSSYIDDLALSALKTRFSGDLANSDAKQIWNFYQNSARNMGYLGFITSVLEVEAGFYKNTSQNISMFTEIIEEELTKAGVKKSIIYGTTSNQQTFNEGDTQVSEKNLPSNSPWLWLAAAIIVLYVMSVFSA